jgi:hypothetical protein
MSQVTIYLDEKTLQQSQKLAKQAGASFSQWVASRLKGAHAEGWPPAVKRLAGAWRDVAIDTQSTFAKDSKRETF